MWSSALPEEPAAQAPPRIGKQSKRSSPLRPPRRASSARPATAPSAACAFRFTTPSSRPPSKPSPASCANSSALAAERNEARRRKNPLSALSWSRPLSDKVEQQHFGVFYAGEFDGLFRGNGRAVAFFQWGAVQLDAAARHLHVGVPSRLQFMSHRFAGAEHRCVQLIVLADFYRAVSPIR